MMRAPIADYMATLDANIYRCRSRVARDWARVMRPLAKHDENVPARMPGYFLDRFSFMVAHGGTPAVECERAPAFDAEGFLCRRSEVVSAALRPTRSLGGWTADLDREAELGEFYLSLLRRWYAFAARLSLPSAVTRLESRVNLKWQEIFARTIFFPRAPVVSGPNFFDFLDEEDRQEALEHFGDNAPIDFFCFVQQVHETVHTVQTGEPLLNEVVQAALWVAFLNEQSDLWCLQRNSATGRACITEAPLVESFPALGTLAVDSGLDTYQLAKYNFMPGAYYLLCLWAYAMHGGRIGYREYLKGVGVALNRMVDDGWVWSATRIVTQALETKTPLSAFDLWVADGGA